MKISAAAAALLLLPILVGKAEAREYTVSAVATVTTIATDNNGVVNLNSPGGIIKLGDVFKLNYSFETDGAAPASVFDADPTINIYQVTPINYSVSIGDYAYDGLLPAISLQIWNGHEVDADLPNVDAFSTDLFSYNVGTGNNPFVVGSGLIAEDVNFDAFDFSGTARTNDLLSEVTPYDGFGSKILTYDILNADTQYSVVVETGDVTATITPVPEPAMWAMVIVGFGMAGTMVRLDRRHGVRG
jgi:hypothetical protein